MRSTLTINLSVARACFVQCRGCYNHFGDRSDLVGDEAILVFLRRASQAGLTKVTLCGGDPIARPGILALIEKIKELGFRINLDTVGTALLGDARTAFFGQYDVRQVDPVRLAHLVDLIGIPLDGASQQSVSRFRRGRPELYHELLRTIDVLDRAGATLCINTVVHRGNVDEIPDIVPVIRPFTSIVRWQLFQFAPTGPLGFRNRADYVLETPRFRIAAGRVADAASRAGFTGAVEPKAVEDRCGNYLLIDSVGLAWIPLTSSSGRPLPGGGPDRLILGDIRRADDHAQILAAALSPGDILPQLLKAPRVPSARQPGSRTSLPSPGRDHHR